MSLCIPLSSWPDAVSVRVPGGEQTEGKKKEKKKNNPGQRSFSFSAFKTSEAMHYSPRKTRNTPRHEGAGQSAESKLERQPGRQHFIRRGTCWNAGRQSESRVRVVEQERCAFKAWNWLVSMASVRRRELIREITCSAVGFFK